MEQIGKKLIFSRRPVEWKQQMKVWIRSKMATQKRKALSFVVLQEIFESSSDEDDDDTTAVITAM